MRAVLCGVALIAACAAPLSACARRDGVHVTLMPGASRACSGQVSVTATFIGTGQALPPPQISALTQNFVATRTASGYAFEQNGNTPRGDVMLRASVSEDGAVTSAELSGTGIGPQGAAQSEEMARFAMSAARNIPERMVMGRDFNPGDNLYPPELGQELADSMGASMGLPGGLDLQVETDIPFSGVSDEGGRPTLRFAGVMHVTGAGAVNGQQTALDLPSDVRMSIDAATGLLQESYTSGAMTVTVDGERQMAMRVEQTLTCTISQG